MSSPPLARQYVDEGFVVVHDLVDAEDRARIITDAAAFARGEYPVSNPPRLPDGATDEVALQHVLAIHFPHWVSDVALEMVTHPAIAEVLHQITAAHLPHWDGAVKCCQSMLFVKGPGMPGQAWHQDERYIPTRDRSLVGAWIALDDATIDNGCLWVIPGSHRSGYLWPSRDHGNPDEFDISDESYGFDDAGAIPVEVPAGSVVFFNGHLLHRSLKNRTGGYRRALVNHYLNAWSKLPWQPLGGSVEAWQVPMLDNRTIVPLGEDPYASVPRTEPPRRVMMRPVVGSWDQG
jgi:ectoine hydroxylase-related dioxygenase (phytanoyl-CoA dioxygenase family)